jgi:hypothetical protein
LICPHLQYHDVTHFILRLRSCRPFPVVDYRWKRWYGYRRRRNRNQWSSVVCDYQYHTELIQHTSLRCAASSTLWTVPIQFGPPPSRQQQQQQSYGYARSGSPILGGGPTPAFLAHHQQPQQARAHIVAITVAQQGQGPGSERSLPPLTSLVSPIGVNVSASSLGRGRQDHDAGRGPRPARASSSGQYRLSNNSVGSSSVAHAPVGHMYRASYHCSNGYSSPEGPRLSHVYCVQCGCHQYHLYH